MIGGVLMKYIIRQDGYTLLLTLVIVVLLFLLTASFTVASMNQTKQVNRTDDSFVTTSLAEMGVEYYTKEINKILEARLILLAKDLLKTTDTVQLNTYRQTHNNLFKAEITDLIGIKKTVEGSNYYEIETINSFNNTATGIEFSVKIAGNTAESSKTIDLNFEIDNYLNPQSTNPILKESTTLESFQTVIDQYPHMVKTYSSSSYPNHTNLNGQELVFFPSDTSLGQLFNDGMIGINVYSKEVLTFLKHTSFTSTQLEGQDINFDFKSGAKAFMIDSIFKANTIEMQFNNNQELEMTRSKICINNPYSTQNSVFLTDIKFLDSTSRVYFQQAVGVATKLNPTLKYDQLSTADYKQKCSFDFKYYDVDVNEGEIIEEIDYN